MPELPEVETVMRGLAARLTGLRIMAVRLTRFDLRWRVPRHFASVLKGARVVGFRRRGKYIFIRLDIGVSVLVHLGMSGRVTIDQNAVCHQHLTVTMEDGCCVGFIDPRRFGTLDLVESRYEDSHRLIAGLGPEPLESGFDQVCLARGLAGKARPIKLALLDQAVVAGIGNIYANEALFRARINPSRPAGTLDMPPIGRLVLAIKEVLTAAIAAGGSSLRDYVRPSGELGYFQRVWGVYDRAGQPCNRCPGLQSCRGIVRIVQSGRASYFCPRTQN